MDMEMERMLGCQIPAFGVWNYCSDQLPITQCFDLAMHARLLKRGGERRLVLFNTSPSPRKTTQIKVKRRQVEKHGGELLQAEEGGTGGRVAALDGTPSKRMLVAAGAVDEDLYKVPPPPLLHQKPRKMRKVVWSLWIGCLGLDCIVAS